MQYLLDLLLNQSPTAQAILPSFLSLVLIFLASIDSKYFHS
jgi:hypothetical protein